MRKLCIVLLLLAICCAHGAAIKTGKERLRELVVEPSVNLNFNFPEGASRTDFLEDYLVPAAITKLRKETKEHPDDPERLLELGILVDRSSDETNNGTEYYEQAEKAARRKSATRPQDGLTLTCLGKALDDLGKADEAENVFRKATVVSSNEWKCWVGLGRFLGEHALYEIVPKNYTNQSTFSLDTFLSTSPDYKPAPDTLAKSVTMRRESEKSFERATSLAPKEPDVYLARASIAEAFALEDWLNHYYRDGKLPDANQYRELCFPTDRVEYLEKAARLCPDDYRVIGVVLFQEITWGELKVVQQSPADTNPPLAHFPEKTQAFVREIAAHLETLSQSTDKRTAAGALQYLGFFKMSIKDYPGATADFRHSATLEPANERAWDLLLAMIKDTDSTDEFVQACQSLVKTKNSAQNHMLLAKALIKQKKYQDAVIELNKAAELEPNNALPWMIGGAMALEQSADEVYLQAAGGQMTRANELLWKTPDGAQKEALVKALALNSAILCALSDKPADAKNWLKEVLNRYPDDQTAKDIMSAIE